MKYKICLKRINQSKFKRPAPNARAEFFDFERQKQNFCELGGQELYRFVNTDIEAYLLYQPQSANSMLTSLQLNTSRSFKIWQ